MSKYRSSLPQLGKSLFLTDGGMETTFIFQDGLNLPSNAAFDLLKTEAGRAHVRAYYMRYIDIARRDRAGLILETPTWRASPDWGDRLGYSRDALAEVNRESVAMLAALRTAHETEETPLVVSGCIGPRGDGYDPGTVMSAAEAADYHGFQARIFAESEADMIGAMTMTNVNEAVGVARAAKQVGMPVSISFTVETDGRLPTGQDLGDAIREADVTTGRWPTYYMINCAHPTHFERVIESGGSWIDRLRGIRANASRKSHAELDESTQLDAGDPDELGTQYRRLRGQLPHLSVVGGCCGTDHRHVQAISLACKAA